MKKILIIFSIIIAFGLGANAQDSTAFIAAQSNLAVDSTQKFAIIPTPPGSSLRLSGDWTIEAWVNISVFSSKNSIVETYSSGSTGGFALRIINTGKLQAYQILNGAGNFGRVESKTILDTNTWYHIAATLNETNQELKIYIDGELEGTTSTAIKTSNSNSFLKIASLGDAFQANGKTAIDEIRIWGFAKTQSEIQADTVACFTGDEPNLLAWYDFENVTDSVLLDKSINNNDGTFENYHSSSFTGGAYRCISVGIEEQSTNINLSIYPNPANDYFIASFETASTKKVEIVVADINGKEVTQRVQLTLISGQNQVEIATGNIPSGVYFVKVISRDGMQYKKLIIN